MPRLQRRVRPKARYERSHWVLRTTKQLDPDVLTKSGMMLGLGETWDEILQTLTDMAETGVDIFTIGQYLRPSKKHQKLERYYRPEEFAELKEIGESLGIRHVESGPLVRSLLPRPRPGGYAARQGGVGYPLTPSVQHLQLDHLNERPSHAPCQCVLSNSLTETSPNCKCRSSMSFRAERGI